MSVPIVAESMNIWSPSERGRLLIVEGELYALNDLESQLLYLGFELLKCQSGKQAIELFEANNIDIVLINAPLTDMRGIDLVRRIKAQSAEDYVPVVLLASGSDDEKLLDYMKAGADDFLHCLYTSEELNARIKAIERLRELRHSYIGSINEQVVAKQILSAALSARNVDVDGMRILSHSAAIFSGDLVVSARNPSGGLNILLADFTGHGLSAAIGVLPVADMFSVMTEKGFGSEIILKHINNKLYTLLPTGMFMAACMVEINSNSCRACVWNSGMPDVYLLDSKTGLIKQQIRSTHIPLGINKEIGNRLEFDDFDIAPGDQFVMHSDGLTEVKDSSGNMFGANRLEQIMEKSPNVSVFDAIKKEFIRLCANQEFSDDVTLITFPCGENLNQSLTRDVATNMQDVNCNKGGWRFMMEVSGSRLRHINPIPIILDQYLKLGDPVVCTDMLQRILSELYDNSLNHGVLELSHLIDSSEKNEYVYDQERDKRFGQIPYGFIRIEIQEIIYQGDSSLLIRLEDSGRGFDHMGMLSGLVGRGEKKKGACSSGIPLVKELCQSLHYLGRGNRVEAIVGLQQHSGEDI